MSGEPGPTTTAAPALVAHPQHNDVLEQSHLPDTSHTSQQPPQPTEPLAIQQSIPTNLEFSGNSLVGNGRRKSSVRRLPRGCCVHVKWCVDESDTTCCTSCSQSIGYQYSGIFDMSFNLPKHLPPQLNGDLTTDDYSWIREEIRSLHRSLGIMVSLTAFIVFTGVLTYGILSERYFKRNTTCERTHTQVPAKCFDWIFITAFVGAHLCLVIFAILYRRVANNGMVKKLNKQFSKSELVFVWKGRYLRFEKM
eukprot:c10212_g1_i1.p1 GENE.c10212_g1_i1~~c10212_g1_i1.p1  ORF type:complete len:285 (+),score=84.06 c10212_g1_i1:104-856(+)